MGQSINLYKCTTVIRILLTKMADATVKTGGDIGSLVGTLAGTAAGILTAPYLGLFGLPYVAYTGLMAYIGNKAGKNL